MKYEDADVDDEEARLGRIRSLMSPVVPQLPPMRLRGAHQGGEARTHVACVQATAAQVLYRVVENALETPVGGSDRMMVERILASRGDTSVDEVETFLVRVRSETARKDCEMNKAELRALQ